MNALVGWTGFVGSELITEGTDLYNSSNIESLRGKTYDCIYFSGLPAEKWRINKDPEPDRVLLENIFRILDTVSVKRFVLISTIDVLDSSVIQGETGTHYASHPYGSHRRRMEAWVQTNIEDHYILRLPALFGKGLKKNILYDLIFRNNIELISLETEFQWYPVSNILRDIDFCIRGGHRLIHLVEAPLRTRRIVSQFFPEYIDDCKGVSTLRYNFTTAIQRPSVDIIAEITEYISYEKKINEIPLSVSNMAWKHQDTKDVLSILRKFRIGRVEVAPTIVAGDWDTPFEYPYPISSFQSILYNTGICIYEDPDAFVSHYRKVAKLCSTHGVHSVVFGSPNQRHVSAGVDIVPYFKTIADISREYSVSFCIEPNSKKYGCTWLTTVSEVVDFLKKVGDPDVIKLNLDTGNYIMENDTFVFDAESVKYIGNVQVSNEHLEPICSMTSRNKATTARVLKNIASVGYTGYISLEMKLTTLSKIYSSVSIFVNLMLGLDREEYKLFL
jgi:hypothetical protein